MAIKNQLLSPVSLAPSGAGVGVFNAPYLALGSGTRRYTILPDSPQLSWEDGERSATETYLMQSEEVAGFVQMAIGLDVPYYDAPFMMRNKRRFPGNPDLVASKVTARPFEDERPCDPCTTDPRNQTDIDSWNQTYSRLMQVTVEYSSKANIERGISGFRNKYTVSDYTEKKSTAGGEFLLIGQAQTYFVPVVRRGFSLAAPFADPLDMGGFSYVNKDPADPNWQLNPATIAYEPVSTEDLARAQQNTAIEVSHAKVIPTREITITWRHVFHVPYRTIKEALGRVNAAKELDPTTLTYVPVSLATPGIFDYAAPETVLFTGANITQENLFAPDGRPLFTVEYKFIEKTIFVYSEDKTIIFDEFENPPPGATRLSILGWNHFWRQTGGTASGATPGTPHTGGAWERLILNKTTGETPYNQYDFLRLFAPEPHGFIPMPSGRAMFQKRRERDAAERGNALINPLP